MNSLFIVFVSVSLGVCHAITCNHGDLTNVAYSKPVNLSTYHNESAHPRSLAVNGKFDDVTATMFEVSPWLRIYLGERYVVHEIEVFARTDCCEDRLHDVEFKVGDDADHMHSCGRYTGPTKNGQRIAVFCPGNTAGQIVQLQIVDGERNELALAEVLVWGRPGY